MATAGSKRGGGSSKPTPAAADQAEFDPTYEWQETATSFILRIHLSGFRKQDFRVQVDGAGRLTVRGQRSDAAANPKHSRFSKVFQLPSTSNLDDISGRFDAGVLTLTVPKRQPAKQQQEQVQKDQAAAATKQQEKAKAPPAGDAKTPLPQDQRKAKQDEEAKKPKDDAVAKPKAKDEVATTKKPAAEQVADAKSGKPEPEQQHKAAAPPPPAVKKEESKPKPGAPAAPAAAPAPAARLPAAATDTKQQAATPKPTTPPPPADAERKAVDPESLAEMVKRRTEEERAKAAAAAEEAEERQRKACRGFKERVTEELQGLAGSEWAEGLVETVKRNKEVIAAAVAAFSLGVFVSSRFFCRSRNGN